VFQVTGHYSCHQVATGHEKIQARHLKPMTTMLVSQCKHCPNIARVDVAAELLFTDQLQPLQTTYPPRRAGAAPSTSSHYVKNDL
jgi:hypothetical protein